MAKQLLVLLELLNHAGMDCMGLSWIAVKLSENL